MALRDRERDVLLHEWGHWARTGQQRSGIKPQSWALLYRTAWNEPPRRTRIYIDDTTALRMDQAIAESSDDTRRTAVLYYVYGLSERQVARALGVPRRHVTLRREHVVYLLERMFYR